jgi:NAD(P)H-hydrate epimerase
LRQNLFAGIDLMERAAKAFIAAFIKKFPADHPVFIFCGYGNNGGDGLAIGRMLLQHHYDVQVFLLADNSKLFHRSAHQ